MAVKRFWKIEHALRMYAKIYVYLKIVRCSNRMYHGGIFVWIWNTIGRTCSKYSHTQQGCVNTSELICASQICEMPFNTARYGFANFTMLHIYWIVSHLHLLFCRVHSRNLLYHMADCAHQFCFFMQICRSRERANAFIQFMSMKNVTKHMLVRTNFFILQSFVKEIDSSDCEREII